MIDYMYCLKGVHFYDNILWKLCSIATMLVILCLYSLYRGRCASIAANIQGL